MIVILTQQQVDALTEQERVAYLAALSNVKVTMINGAQTLGFESREEHDAYVANYTPPDTISQYYIAAENDRGFCYHFQTLLIGKLREQNLTNTQRGTLLNTIQVGMNALSWGDAAVARAAFNSIATTALWTQARKDWVLLQIDEFLNS